MPQKGDTKYYVGKRLCNKYNQWYTIIEWIDGLHRNIKFDDCDIIVTTNLNSIKKQSVKHPSVKGYHAESNTRLYKIWCGMKNRCSINNHTINAKWYSNKGIKVCKEWEIYNNFKLWALSNGYDDNLTIDRIDADKNYCPENCQWIPMEDNARKVNGKKVIAIGVYTRQIYYFDSIIQASKYIHKDHRTLTKVLNGDTKYNHILCDFYWYYEKDYNNASTEFI